MSTLDSSCSYYFGNSRCSDGQGLIKELLLIQEQTQLMEGIMKNGSISKSRVLANQVTDISFEIPPSSHYLDVTMSCNNITREFSFTNIDEPDLERALKEIGSKCGRKTFSLIKSRLSGSAERRIQIKLQKQKKHNAQLVKKISRLNERIMEFEMKLTSIGSEYSSMKKDQISSKKKIAELTNSNHEKETDLLKWEKSLLYKQKMLLASQKKIEKQLQLIDEEKTVNEKIADLIDKFMKKAKSLSKNNKEPLNLESVEEVVQQIQIKENLLEKKEKCILDHYYQIQEIAEKNKKNASPRNYK